MPQTVEEITKAIISLSNEDLAKVASLHRSRELIDKHAGATQIGNGWNTNEIVKRLESLEHTIQTKPETNIELERIIDGAMTIMRETKKGHTVTYNRYRTGNKW